MVEIPSILAKKNHAQLQLRSLAMLQGFFLMEGKNARKRQNAALYMQLSMLHY